MLLDDEPAFLISSTTDNFNIDPDKEAVSRIQRTLTDLDSARNVRLREAEFTLKRLARTHNQLSNNHQQSLSSHSSTAHASRIVELDARKFSVAKEAHDLEIESDRLEAELEAQRARLQELEVQGVEGDEASRLRQQSQDPVLLRLAIYRELGIDVEADSKTGRFGKAVVRNAKKGDVHVVNIDPKFSRFFYSDFFWKNI